MKSKKLEKIVLFLNGSRGLAVLDVLVRSGYDIAAIVTPPNNKTLSARIKRNYDSCLHLEISDVNGLNAIRYFSYLEPSIFIIAGFSSIFGSNLLAVPKFGTLNLHAGKLPEYRGGSPLNWQMINGELSAGISVIQADAGIDTGQVLAEAFIPIQAETTIADLHQEANTLFPKLVTDALSKIRNKESGRIQSDLNARYWHQRNDADGQLFFQTMTVNQVDVMVRALTRPYPGAWCSYKEKVCRVFAVEVPQFVLMGVPGRICYIQGMGPYVVCADRAVLLCEYQFENGGTPKLCHGDHLL